MTIPKISLTRIQSSALYRETSVNLMRMISKKQRECSRLFLKIFSTMRTMIYDQNAYKSVNYKKVYSKANEYLALAPSITGYPSLSLAFNKLHLWTFTAQLHKFNLDTIGIMRPALPVEIGSLFWRIVLWSSSI